MKMVGLIDYANRTIDDERADGPVNRVTNELTELADDLAVVESFSHSWVVRTGDGLVVFDASSVITAGRVIAAIREWTPDPIHTIVYTHGHADHVGGAAAFLADAASRGHARPQVVGHANVAPRLARYRLTNDYNVAINLRQFAPSRRRNDDVRIGQRQQFVPEGTPDPDQSFTDELAIEVGGERFVLRHDRGETDDHAWTEWQGRRTLFVGDMLIWNFPNCGNPQKVLRYPAEWAAALRKMIALDPELVAPAHGLPVSESGRAGRVLGTTAAALEGLVADVIELLNADATLDDALHTVRVPGELLALPWLRPFYDEPEFVVRNIWRTYGGWWDGNPAHLLPPRQRDLANEVVVLAGGSAAVVARARELAGTGELRVACELIEIAAQAEHTDVAVHTARAEIYARHRAAATSLMAKGIFEAAVNESTAIAGIDTPAVERVPPLA
jgi:glyoxylase-like metal-dependent hydrolase (beta-lactamase superfamily II)